MPTLKFCPTVRRPKDKAVIRISEPKAQKQCCEAANFAEGKLISVRCSVVVPTITTLLALARGCLLPCFQSNCNLHRSANDPFYEDTISLMCATVMGNEIDNIDNTIK